MRSEDQFVETHVFHNKSVLSASELFSSRRIGNKRAIGKRGKGDKTSFVRYGGRARSERALSEVAGPKRGEKRMERASKRLSFATCGNTGGARLRVRPSLVWLEEECCINILFFQPNFIIFGISR